jgi:hypothetical protein
MQSKQCAWNAEALVSFLLRTGLAVTFLFAAIASFIEPVAWIGFLPEWMRNLLPETLLLFGFSLYEMFLAFWLLSNKKPFEAAVFSSLTLLLIVLANMTVLYVVFRDVAILFAALALVVLNYKKRNKTNKKKKETKRRRTP